ncbi:hypothetical protein KSZ_22170 [Dictyobacter formicarum]|uniref:Uncharacterized protein n=1 Tax=Dictyobacter formicarum TaxID=2778368 RepID=A0ABQ3VGG7_9CHLR|nr:hypothetical protein KSZ_22170 [Dictyobacter formicarum]
MLYLIRQSFKSFYNKTKEAKHTVLSRREPGQYGMITKVWNKGKANDTPTAGSEGVLFVLSIAGG